MKIIPALLSLLAFANAASIVPIDTSIVNVKSENSGQDYSYSIQENRAFAYDPSIGHHHPIAIAKTAQGITSESSPGSDSESNGHVNTENHKEHHEFKQQPIHRTTIPIQEIAPLPVAFPAFYLPTYQYSYSPAFGGIAYPHNVMAYKVA